MSAWYLMVEKWADVPLAIHDFQKPYKIVVTDTEELLGSHRGASNSPCYSPWVHKVLLRLIWPEWSIMSNKTAELRAAYVRSWIRVKLFESACVCDHWCPAKRANHTVWKSVTGLWGWLNMVEPCWNWGENHVEQFGFNASTLNRIYL